MTTPEQLDKWTCEFKAGLKQWEVHLINGEMSPEMKLQLQGYLRRCQETEQDIAELVRNLQGRHKESKQAIKDARKQALEDAYAIYITSQALKPITATDITPTMHQEWNKIFLSDDMSIVCPKDDVIMAAAYNAVIKNRSEAR